MANLPLDEKIRSRYADLYSKVTYMQQQGKQYTGDYHKAYEELTELEKKYPELKRGKNNS